MSKAFVYGISDREAREIVASVNGLYVGQLDTEEMHAFEIGLREGFSGRDYEGIAGLLGVAKVRYLP